MRGNPQVLIRVGDVGRIFVQHFEGRAKLRDSKLKFQIYNKNGCFINYWPLGGLIINVGMRGMSMCLFIWSVRGINKLKMLRGYQFSSSMQVFFSKRIYELYGWPSWQHLISRPHSLFRICLPFILLLGTGSRIE